MRRTSSKRKSSGRKLRGDDGTRELFSGQLSVVVEKAFAAKLGEAKPDETRPPPESTPVENLREGESLREPLPENAPPVRPANAACEVSSASEIIKSSPGEPPDAQAKRRDAASTIAQLPLDSTSSHQDSLPARMLNEFVYCPRLFFYEHVEGVFVESRDTVRGAAIHERVDKGSGAMPMPGVEPQTSLDADTSSKWQRRPAVDPPSSAEAETIHSRSVMLGSDRLGVIAKMDLVETTLDKAGSVASVCPVDYKAGSPRTGEHGLGLWDTDRMQLGLQCLLLRDNGYACDAGIIYYRGTKQRVQLDLTPDLEAWVVSQIAAARTVAAGSIPPPLIDSPKCTRCSLAPVCLPDETHWLAMGKVESSETGTSGNSPPVLGDVSPRRLLAPRDEKRALYLNTQGYSVGCNDSVIKVKESRAVVKKVKSIGQAQDSQIPGTEPRLPESGSEFSDRVVEEVRLMDVSHVALFGNIQMSTQAVQRLCDREIPVTWFSMGGWFYGMTRGHSLKNVLLRIEQFRRATDPADCLRLARQFVRGKIHNHRVFFMRNHVEPPERVKLRLGQAREDALAARSLEELLGVEGAAAAVYFQQFGGLIREQHDDDDFLEGLASPTPATPAPPKFSFDFTTRNRRPPTDPVNALLSLAYSLLAKECTLAACAVGFDPYVGFYHQPRHGRPALALDLMEEFRPLIAESTVLMAINNRLLSSGDFVTAGRAVNLSASGRKQFFQCFEQRINSLITHPVFDYKVSYRRAIELQFRILARVLTGEIPEYIPFMTR